MITEDYVSFKTAKLLKEKGFDEDCLKYYVEGQKYIRDLSDEDWSHRLKNSKAKENVVTVPTLQMAMKWLREVRGLFISIGNDDLDYNWQIFDIKNRTKDLDPTCLTESYAGYRKYEEACEAAIKYCLEKLI